MLTDKLLFTMEENWLTLLLFFKRCWKNNLWIHFVNVFCRIFFKILFIQLLICLFIYPLQYLVTQKFISFLFDSSKNITVTLTSSFHYKVDNFGEKNYSIFTNLIGYQTSKYKMLTLSVSRWNVNWTVMHTPTTS